MMAVLGVCMVASLSGSALMKGIIVGGSGLILATVGTDPMLSVERWTFGQVYLWDGFHVVPLSPRAVRPGGDHGPAGIGQEHRLRIPGPAERPLGRGP